VVTGCQQTIATMGMGFGLSAEFALQLFKSFVVLVEIFQLSSGSDVC
jgi:hypothetical protein